jgi:hypothetical protein
LVVMAVHTMKDVAASWLNGFAFTGWFGSVCSAIEGFSAVPVSSFPGTDMLMLQVYHNS